jgi:hypothetical protein
VDQSQSRLLELQTAKEILAEIFHARPGEVEEMIQNRLEEKSGERSAAGKVKRSYGRRVLCG